jgi:hypothetical protein
MRISITGCRVAIASRGATVKVPVARSSRANQMSKMPEGPVRSSALRVAGHPAPAVVDDRIAPSVAVDVDRARGAREVAGNRFVSAGRAARAARGALRPPRRGARSRQASSRGSQCAPCPSPS